MAKYVWEALGQTKLNNKLFTVRLLGSTNVSLGIFKREIRVRCISPTWPRTGVFRENSQDWISKDVSLRCSAVLPWISVKAWAVLCGSLIIRKVSSLLPRIWILHCQEDKASSHTASARYADWHPLVLNKHHQFEQRHPQSTKSCGVCYMHHIQRRRPFLL